MYRKPLMIGGSSTVESEKRKGFAHVPGRRSAEADRFCDLQTRAALLRERERCDQTTGICGWHSRHYNEFAYDLTGIEVVLVRFQVRRLLPFRPCVITGAVERVSVSFVRSSLAWRC